MESCSHKYNYLISVLLAVGQCSHHTLREQPTGKALHIMNPWTMNKTFRVLLASIVFNLYYIIPQLQKLSSEHQTITNNNNDVIKDVIKDEKEGIRNVLKHLEERLKERTKNNRCALLLFGLPVNKNFISSIIIKSNMHILSLQLINRDVSKKHTNQSKKI